MPIEVLPKFLQQVAPFLPSYHFGQIALAILGVPAQGSVLGVLSSVVALVYYLRLVKIMYFDEPAEAFDPVGGLGSKAVLLLSSAAVLLFIVAASPVITAADAAAKALLP